MWHNTRLEYILFLRSFVFGLSVATQTKKMRTSFKLENIILNYENISVNLVKFVDTR